jgi:DNA-binding response OmpR family regulator
MEEARQRILVVENDQDTLFLIETALSNAGYFVETCIAGSGIVEFQYTVPDLFILDKELPTIDGIAVCKFLRLQAATRAVPIIMISGYQVKNKAKQAGIDEFVKKPFHLNYLLRLVKKYVSH